MYIIIIIILKNKFFLQNYFCFVFCNFIITVGQPPVLNIVFEDDDNPKL